MCMNLVHKSHEGERWIMYYRTLGTPSQLLLLQLLVDERLKNDKTPSHRQPKIRWQLHCKSPSSKLAIAPRHNEKLLTYSKRSLQKIKPTIGTKSLYSIVHRSHTPLLLVDWGKSHQLPNTNSNKSHACTTNPILASSFESVSTRSGWTHINYEVPGTSVTAINELFVTPTYRK